MTTREPPRLANASWVTDHLLVGGDLDARDDTLAERQLAELVELGVTHLVDVRLEWDDLDFVAERASDIVRGKPLLAASNAEVGLAPGVGVTQRSGKPLRAIRQ